MTQEEALRMALEALERSVATCFDQRSHYEVMGRPEHFVNKAITALRLAIDVQNMASESTYKEALAQMQEPVGQLLEDAFGRGQVMWFNKPKDESMLYTTPPQIEVGCAECGVNGGHALYCVECAEKFVGEAATKLKQKNNTGENN